MGDEQSDNLQYLHSKEYLKFQWTFLVTCQASTKDFKLIHRRLRVANIFEMRALLEVLLKQEFPNITRQPSYQ